MDRSLYNEPPADASDEIDVRQFLILLLNRKWFILTFLILGIAAGLAYAKLATPIFQATALVEVLQLQRNVAHIVDGQTQDLRSDDVIKTIESNLQSITIFLRIANREDFKTDAALQENFAQPINSIGPLELAEKLKSWTLTGLKKGTRQIAVTGEHSNPAFAANLANAVVEEFINESEEKRLEELQLAGDFLAKEHKRITGAHQDAIRILGNFNQVKETRDQIEEQQNALNVLKAQGKADLHPDVIEVQTLLESYEKDFESGMARARQDLEGNAQSANQGLNTAVDNKLNAEFELLKSREAEISTRVGEYQATLEDILGRKTDNNMAMELPAPPIRVAVDAYQPSKPIKPKKLQALAASIVLSTGMGLFIVFGLHFLDRSVKTVDEAERVIGMKVLGAIPTDSRIPKTDWLDPGSKRDLPALLDRFAQETASGKKIPTAKKGKRSRGPIDPLVMLSDPGSPLSEAFRSLRASLTLIHGDQEQHSLLITSSVPGEGKSFVASNLAVAFAAQEGQRTLLIDADLRRPMVHRLFGLDMVGGGLTEALTSGKVEVIASGVGQLDLLPAGDGGARPAELLSGPRLKRLVEGLVDKYDRIIFDTAPVNTVSDALLLAPCIGATLLVARAAKTPRAAILHAREQLSSAGTNPAGMVLNSLPEKAGLASNPYFYYYDGESQKYGNNYR